MAKPGSFQAMMEATFCAFCVAPIVLILGLALAGYNEKISVCNMHAISDGSRLVKSVPCEGASAAHGLVMFSCPLKKTPLNLGEPGMGLMGELTPSNFNGAALRVQVDMYQCNEKKTETKDAQNRTVINYSYSKGYFGYQVATPVGPNALANCGGTNPMWPVSVPRMETQYNSEIFAGDHKLDKFFHSMISVDTPVAPEVPHWTRSAAGFTSSAYRSSGGFAGNPNANAAQFGPQLGDLQAKFFTTSSAPMTVLGYERTGKEVIEWRAPSAWLCSGFTLGTLREAVLSKAELFATLHAENDTTTVFLRVLAFCLLWGAFAGMVSPLGVLADCLPFVQSVACLKCLADAVDALLCAAACCPATACFMLVAGIVWVVMRPMVGGPMLFLTIGILGFMGYVRSVRKGSDGQGTEQSEPLKNGE